MADTISPQPSLDDDEDLEAALRAAEDAVAELAANFTVWVGEDLDKARAALDRAKSSDPIERTAVDEIFGICHNIKGQAGSFGYDLMTQVAAKLCDFLRNTDVVAQSSLGVIEGHLMALRFILDHRIEGAGGDVGAKLIAKLDDLATV